MENGMKEWVRSLETKLDRCIEVGIRTETKVDSLQQQYAEVQSTIKSHDLRLSEIENKQSKQDGGMRMLAWVGSVVAGLLLTTEVLILLFKN